MQETGLLLFLPLYPHNCAVSQALSDGETYYSSVSSTIQTALDAYSTDADAAFTSLNAVSNRIQTVIDGYTSLADSLTAIKNANPNLSLVIDPILKQISTASSIRQI